MTYCSQLWRPNLIKDILMLERVQCRATKYILNDFFSSYKSRLITLHLLPLMYLYELNEMFLVKSLKSPSHSFNIYNFVSFTSSTMRSSAANKLTHHRPTGTLTQHFYFTRISHLWNILPVIDLTLFTSTIHNSLKEYFGATSLATLTVTIPVPFTYFALAVDVPVYPRQSATRIWLTIAI